MIRDFLDGVAAYFRAFSLIREYNLWKYLFLSGILSLLVGFSLYYSAFAFAGDLGHFISTKYTWYGAEFVQRIARWLAGSLLVIFAFMLYRYIVMIVVSPIMSLLSENLEYKLSGHKKNSGWNLTEIISDMLRGIGLTLRNMTKEICITLLILFIGLIFAPLAFLTAPLIFIVQAYYSGFGNIDFYLERRMNISESTEFINDNRGLAIGNGSIYLLLLMVPILGLIIAPTLSTISGTYEAHKRLGHIHDYV